MNANRVATATHARGLAAYAVAALSPAVAWLAWISWSGGVTNPVIVIAFCATAAAGCLVAGCLSNHRASHLAALIVVAILAVLTTLFFWWSSEDLTGMFGAGLMLATPLVIVSATTLVLAGSAIAR